MFYRGGIASAGARGGGGSALPFDAIYFTPGDFNATATGTPPTLTNNNTVAVWSFVDAATGEIVTSFLLPGSWRTTAVDFFWINPSAGSGAVRWRVAVKDIDTGELTTKAFAVDTAANLTAAGQNVLSPVSAHVSNFNVTPNGFGTTFSMLISRIGADAGDTLAAAAELQAVRLYRTS